jgi:hypothetical protein
MSAYQSYLRLSAFIRGSKVLCISFGVLGVLGDSSKRFGGAGPRFDEPGAK